MYIRRKKTPNSPRQSIQIVEGYRDSKGNVKQRIVGHVGVFIDEVEEAKLVALGSVDKNFNVTILKFQRNLEKLRKWLEPYQI